MEKNLFLNTFADVKQISIGAAKQRIIKMAWKILKRALKDKGYTAKELKDAYEILTTFKSQDVYDSGIIEVEGREYNLFECLA